MYRRKKKEKIYIIYIERHIYKYNGPKNKENETQRTRRRKKKKKRKKRNIKFLSVFFCFKLAIHCDLMGYDPDQPQKLYIYIYRLNKKKKKKKKKRKNLVNCV